MEWLSNLICGTSIAHTAFLYALVIAAGVLLGRIKIFGVTQIFSSLYFSYLQNFHQYYREI